MIHKAARSRRVAPSTVRRLSLYLGFLEQRRRDGAATVPSRALAEAGGATPAQVRKDLSFFGSFGRRGVGYPVAPLAERVRAILGLDRGHRVVVVGAGPLGAALAPGAGWRERGFEVAAVYDLDPARIGTAQGGLVVRDAARLEADLAGRPADIGVVGVPVEAAQGVADRLVRAGVRALLNLAPVHLDVPSGVAVTQVNLALELDALAFAIRAGGRK